MSYRRDVEDRMENPNLLRDLGINPPGKAEPTDEQMLRAYSPELWMHIEGQQRLDVLRAVRAGLTIADQQSERPAPAGQAELLARAAKLANARWTSASVDCLQKVLLEVLAALAASQAEPTELLRAMVGWYSTHGTLHHSDVMGKAKAFLAKEK